MPLHDRFLRTTPYERIFPDRETRDRTLDAIHEEIQERGEGGDDPGAVALLRATRTALTELREKDESEDTGHTHAILLFHAHHLRQYGEPHFLVETAVSRWAVEAREQAAASDDVEAAHDASDESGLPTAAYLQLPRYLFWVRESAADRPLALDGFFRTEVDGVLHVLGVVDLPASEGALRVIPLPGVPVADAPLWLQEPARESGDDFRSEMPGSELEGLYELRTAGEFLKLAARLEHFVRRFPDAVREVEVDAEAEGASALPHRVLRLQEG